MSSSKGYWYSLFGLGDTSFSLSQLFGESIDELLDVFEIIGFFLKSRMSGLWRLHRRDCRIGTLIIKTSALVRKRESLKIRLIVCICSARFGDRTTSLEFLH